jgi:hypothetical protein
MTGLPYHCGRLDGIIIICIGSSSDLKMAELCVHISPRTVIQLISYVFCSGLDFAPPTAAGRVFDKKTPVIVALHGLAGGTPMKLGGVAGSVIPDTC